MATAINLSNSEHVIKQTPPPTSLSSLYRAQDAAKLAVKTVYFPRYTPEYVQSQTGIAGAVLRCYSAIYEVIYDLVQKVRSLATNLFNSAKSAGQTSPLVQEFQEIAHSLVNLAKSVIQEISEKSKPFAEPAAAKIKTLLFPINPITGRRNFCIVPRIVEKKLGDWLIYPLNTWEHFETSVCLAGTKESMSARVKQVADRIFTANQNILNPVDETKFNYRIKTLDSQNLNAYAVPGGGMVMFSKLVQELQGAIDSCEIENTTITMADGSKVTLDLKNITLDDALAAIIGHEVTHAASRHGALAITFMLLWSIVDRIREILFPGNWNARVWSNRIREKLEAFLSRRAEHESDVGGAYLMQQGNFNPLGAIYAQEFLLRKQSEMGGFLHRLFELNSSHPIGEKRKRALFAAIGEIAPDTLSQAVLKREERGAHKLLETSNPAVQAAASIANAFRLLTIN